MIANSMRQVTPARRLAAVKRYRAYVLFGPPGCGKGTQGRALGLLPGLFHCACGDVFRAISPATPLGKKISEYSRRGELVTDELTMQVWQSYIRNCTRARSFNPKTDKLLLDGIPRNIDQAHLLEQTVQVEAVIHLRCSPSLLISRLRTRALRENRTDDAKVEVIRRRLDIFETATLPLLEYYSRVSIFTVDAQQGPTKVLFDILSHIHKL
jgi:adenylate kinase